MPQSTIPDRLADLRKEMTVLKLDVYLVPTADEHHNEYLPPHKLRREAITGFSGSAGDAAICLSEAHLFVDSRYHLQADQEVDSTLFTLHKLGLEGEQNLMAWLTAFETSQGVIRVGYDPYLVSIQQAKQLANSLKLDGSALVPVEENLVDKVWSGAVPAKQSPVYQLSEGLTGETVVSKLTRLRESMQKEGASGMVLTKLDDVAWLTNLRGGDIAHNPVFEAYLIATMESATCFTNAPIPADIQAKLKGNVEFLRYGEFRQELTKTVKAIGAQDGKLWLDGESTSQGVRLLAGEALVVETAPNPVVNMKARKNPVEVEAMRAGHVLSGCAKVRAISLLESRLAEGEQISEAGFARLLEDEYRQEEGFSDLSFGTISAYGPNAAIVHYGTPGDEVMLKPGGMLLVDSGIQVAGATTDDTRTLIIGEPSEDQKRHFSDVLRGHIRLAMQVFPEGTTGTALDALARSPLWNAGTDYGHGTGHGVGAFLNVHEGPQNISSRGMVALEPGMVLSNEPGYYHAGWGGIRLENLYVVEEALGMAPHPSGKKWLRFSPLTLIPFDRRLVEPNRLSQEELDWLNSYHAYVLETLSPHLPQPHSQWLADACAPLVQSL